MCSHPSLFFVSNVRAVFVSLPLKQSESQQWDESSSLERVRLALSPGLVSPACGVPAFAEAGVLTCATLQSSLVLPSGDLATRILQDLAWFLPFVYEMMIACGNIDFSLSVSSAFRFSGWCTYTYFSIFIGFNLPFISGFSVFCHPVSP